MNIQARLAAFGGDIWASPKCLCLNPLLWPAVVYGMPKVHFTWDDYRCFTSLMQPGDFILTQSRHYIGSAKFIPGAWKHLAVFTGPVTGYRDQKTKFIYKPRSLGVDRVHTGGQQVGTFVRTITHAISEGVVVQDLGELLFHSDYAAVVRPWVVHSEAQIIVDAALSQSGIGYNFDFKPSGKPASYCTELGAFCCDKIKRHAPSKRKIKASLTAIFLPFDRFKQRVYLADAFLQFPMICCSVACNNPMFSKQSMWPEKVRQAVLTAPDATRFLK